MKNKPAALYLGDSIALDPRHHTADARALTAEIERAAADVGIERPTLVQQLPCNAYERAHPEYCAKGTTTELHHDDDYLHFCLEPMTRNP